jgi:hypothetical protein
MLYVAKGIWRDTGFFSKNFPSKMALTHEQREIFIE